MEEQAVTALQLAGDEVAGLGLWALVAQADPVVKGVLLLLVLASIWSWTVIFDKGFRLRQLRRKAQAFERAFWSGAPLDELYRQLGRSPDHPMAMLFASAMEEWRDAPRPQRQQRARAAGAHREGHDARRSIGRSSSSAGISARSRPSARPRRSSGCSARSGAS